MFSSGNIRSNDTPKICQTKLSIVVPCSNEEDNLAALHRRVSGVAHQTVGDNYELILVDDGSRDRTWPLQVVYRCTGCFRNGILTWRSSKAGHARHESL